MTVSGAEPEVGSAVKLEVPPFRVLPVTVIVMEPSGCPRFKQLERRVEVQVPLTFD
jgi:hypothetical protein